MKIKFSHKYSKLMNGYGYISNAELLDVIIVNLEDLSKELIHYDTDRGVYKLPKSGKYMLLIFRKWQTQHLFTTLRRWTPQKESYYRNNLGHIFDIEFTQNQ